MVSRGVKTPEVLRYKTDTKLKTITSKITYGEGDGTVNWNSLMYGCNAFAKSKEDIFVYDNASHVGLLSTQEVIDDLLRIISDTK